MDEEKYFDEVNPDKEIEEGEDVKEEDDEEDDSEEE